MKKRFKELIEFVKKEETEHGAVGLREHGLFLQDLGKLAKKHGFDCYCKAQPKEKNDHVPTNEQYHIKTVEDIAKLTPTQFEFFIDDLRQYCQTMQSVEVLKEFGAEISKQDPGFIWIDSGFNKAEVTFNVKATNNIG